MKLSLNTMLKTAMMIGIGVALPIAFHTIGWTGRVFLPMHIPVLLAGFLFGPLSGLIVGVTTPFISSIITGMPPMAPMPIALQMSVELGAFGLLAGICHFLLKLNIVFSLLLTLVGGRLAFGLITLALFPLFGLQGVSLTQIFGVSIVTGAPGLVLQLIAIPAIVLAVKKRGVFRPN